MRRMWKYELSDACTVLSLPRGAILAHVAVQPGSSVFSRGEVPCVWALVDDDGPKAGVEVALVTTGGQVPADAIYIGTVHLFAGALVLHAFRLPASSRAS